MTPAQVEEVLKQLNTDYTNLQRILGEEALKKLLASSKLNPTQFKALFEDSFGAFDLAAGGVEAAYTNKAEAAKALHAVANLRRHAEVLNRLSIGQRVSPAELEAAQKAIQAYNAILRTAPTAALTSLKQLQRVVLNSDVELPVYSHVTPEQLRTVGPGGFKAKPQIKSLIGSAGRYDDVVANQVQDIAADYLHHQADLLAPGLAEAHAPTAPQPVPVAAEPVQNERDGDEEAPEEPNPAEERPIQQVNVALPEPELAVVPFNEDHLIHCIIKADQLFERTLQDFMQRSLATHAICFAYMQFNFSAEVLEFRAVQAAIINSYQAAVPVLIHSQFTFFQTSKLDLTEEFAKTRELERDDRQLGKKADEFGIDVDALRSLLIR